MWEVFTTEQEVIVITQMKKDSEATLSFPCFFNVFVLLHEKNKRGKQTPE